MEQTQNIQDLILIVDDIPENLQLLGNILRESNFRVAFATSGQQALTVLNSIIPDLILLDITMPEMDGFTVCERIKKNDRLKNIPVIFLTAHTNKDDVVKGFEVGGIDYVTKPFNSQELKARIKTHLDLKKSKEQIVKQNDKLNKLNIELQELVSSRDQFYSIVAHDLRSPFNTILGFLELLVLDYNGLNEKERISFIDNIYTSSKNLHSLLENLLSWIRSQTGRLSLSPQCLNINTLIKDLLPLYTASFENKSIESSFDGSEKLNIYADYDTISTVIRNLISNAIKFTPKNGYITICSQISGKNALISISDSGIGMSEIEIQKLFIAGKKILKRGTNNEPGTGLGLILTKEFVEKNNGKIWVESQPMHGTTFYFTMPLENPEK